MSRRAFLCVVLLGSLLLIPACSNSDSSTPSAGSGSTATGEGSDKKRVIAFSALTLTNPFFRIIADRMTEEAEKHGFEVLVVSGDQDVKKQTDQIEDFIAKGVDVIVLNPCDSRSIGQAIASANKADIPVFTNDIKYDGDVGKVVCHVATDNYQGGRLAGEAMVRLLGETGGKIGIVHYPDVESCQLRVRGFTEIIDAHNEQPGAAKIEIVATLNGKGDREAGNAVTKDMIEANPELKAIFAINDPSALGARAAIEASGLEKQISIIGFDGAIEGKRAILDGKILCDPIQFPDRIAVTTVQQIIAYLDGDDVPSEILIPSELYYVEDAQKDPELSAGTSAE